MPTVLITGASGLLGRAVLSAFQRSPFGWKAVGTAFSRTAGGLLPLDLLDPVATATAVDTVAPDAVIHCAAERRPDVGAKDPGRLRRLNVEATGRLAAAAALRGAWMLLVSTDYVFDGTTPPYPEDAPTCPLNDYGLSKRDAERALWQTAHDAAVLRVPILFGPTDDLEESAVTAGVARALRDPDTVRYDCDAWAVRHPTGTVDVAAAIVALAELRAAEGPSPQVAGTFHFSAPERMTKYDMAREIAGLFGCDPSILRPLERPSPDAAPRPKDSALSCARLDALGISSHTPFRQALAEALRDAR
ncbi:MAG: dTDP-4-dehydrorhamnose reductase family protein [Kiritimatiellia bacterium]|jgi:dTDP-4-dehydrorhamnose reductase